MKLDLKRDARQEICTEKWKQNKGVGAIDACPRFGKTNVGLKIIAKNRAKSPDSKIVILTPSEVIQKHWENHISDVRVLTSHRAKNIIKDLTDKTIDILIVDELHKFTSDDNVSLLDTLCQHSKFRLALTGTYPHNNNKLKSLFPVVDTITEEEARREGWISEYIEYNIPVSLTDEEKTRYTKFSNLIAETLELFKGKAKLINGDTKLFDDDFDLIMSCYVGKKPKYGTIKYIPGHAIREALAKLMGWTRDLDLSDSHNKERDIYWRPENIYERCKLFRQFISSRNEILINNTAKLNLIKEIIEYNDVPTIIFNESIEFVNTIADALGRKAIAYHSKIKSRPMLDDDGNILRYSTGKVKMFGAIRLKEAAIEGIRSNKYKYLVTAKSLDEGLDLPQLQQVIITAGSTNPVQQLQRSARGKTLDTGNSLKLTHIFNLYVDNFKDVIGTTIISRDKSKLITRQKTYTHSVKWLNNLSDLTL